MKLINKLRLLAIVFSVNTTFTQSEDLINYQNAKQKPLTYRLILEYSEQDISKNYLLGLSRAEKQEEKTRRNIGYFGLEHRSWNGWTHHQAGIYLDMFHYPKKPRQGGLKFKFLIYQEAFDDSRQLIIEPTEHDRVGFAIGVSPIFQPIKGMFFHTGVLARPMFMSFDWDQQAYPFTLDVTTGIDWFLGSHASVISRWQTFQAYDENLGMVDRFNGWWFGARLQI